MPESKIYIFMLGNIAGIQNIYIYVGDHCRNLKYIYLCWGPLPESKIYIFMLWTIARIQNIYFSIFSEGMQQGLA